MTCVSLPAIRYGFSCCLYVPARMIPSNAKSGLFEFRIARSTDLSQTCSLYAAHRPPASRSYVSLFCLNPSQGERFTVQSVTEFFPEEFAHVYNRRPPIGLENIRMVFDGRSFKFRADNGHELAVTEWKLETYQGRIVLHGRLPGALANLVTISVGPFESTIKLLRREPIVSMTAHGDDFVIGYKHWTSDPRVRFRLISPGKREGRLPYPWSHQISFQPEEMELDSDVVVNQKESIVRITFAEEARYRAWRYWTTAQRHNERKAHQGDIGEAVACAFLEKSGYEVLERHTVKSHLFRQKHRCRGPGRDILARKASEYYVAEVKHWIAFADIALKEAERDLVKFARSRERRNLEERLGTRISGGAFAIQLDWSYECAEAILKLKRLDFGELAEGSGHRER